MSTSKISCPPSIKIVTFLEATNSELEKIDRMTAILMHAFAGLSLSYGSFEEARQEVFEMMEPDRICLLAQDTQDDPESGEIIGLICGRKLYGGHVVEVHPLAVDPQFQSKKVGTMLLARLEELAKESGALTVMLGADDEMGLTTLSGQNLYADLPGLISRLANINDSKPHASGFYLKNGYTAIGVIPDANGPGKPDILMAKSIYNVA
jgi:aminoglycoside 6'-N-acetyltransferase I